MEALLRDPDGACAATAVNVAETLDVLVRHMGFDPDDVEEKLRWLTLGGLAILDVDEAIGIEAGRLHAVHYHRTRRPLSLADCVALAASLVRSEPLATSDPALAATARDVGVSVVGLLDARGHRP